MVGDLTCGVFDPAYSSVVGSPAVVENDGQRLYGLSAFVRGCYLGLPIGFLFGLRLCHGVRLGYGWRIRQGRHLATF